MSVPVQGCLSHRVHHFLPCLEPSALDRARAQNVPPRLNQVQVGSIFWLKDELPAWVRKLEEQHVPCAMHIEMVHSSVHSLDLSGNPCLDTLQNVNPVADRPTRVRFRKDCAIDRLKRAEDLA